MKKYSCKQVILSGNFISIQINILGKVFEPAIISKQMKYQFFSTVILILNSF
jgi:hypothetical protein